MNDINPLLYIDFYKADHRRQYPDGTELVYSNFTPRMSRVAGVNHMVFFGLQYAVKEYLIKRFNKDFFERDRAEVVAEYQSYMDCSLGEGAITTEHIGELHDLGYLPILIKALPEGTKVPLGTPPMTFRNTGGKKFFWLTNYLETLLSTLLWKPCTSATTAGLFRNTFEHYAELTGADKGFIDWQGHDFSFRGMSGPEDACMSGAAHLLFFTGTDTLPAIPFLERYYNADRTKEFIGGSVFATEHSVMCAGGKDGELSTLRRLINDLYPTGIISVVSDTWDFWQLVTEFLPACKDEILNRHMMSPPSKVVIRPDSGDPNFIINGDPNSDVECERKGLIRCLDDIFGHTVNAKGYKKLNPAIGAIYGDSINRERQYSILKGLEENGYESTSLVMGMGSFTYQYVTRDTYGTVCKATYVEVNGEARPIFKDPKTGGWKKSHKGLLRVNEDLSVTQDVSWEEEGQGLLEEVFCDGEIIREQSLAEIRERVQ